MTNKEKFEFYEKQYKLTIRRISETRAEMLKQQEEEKELQNRLAWLNQMKSKFALID